MDLNTGWHSKYSWRDGFHFQLKVPLTVALTKIKKKSLLPLRDMTVGNWALEENCFPSAGKADTPWLEWVIATIEDTRLMRLGSAGGKWYVTEPLGVQLQRLELSESPPLLVSDFLIDDYNLLQKSLHKKETELWADDLPPCLWGHWEGSCIYPNAGEPIQRISSREALRRSGYWQPRGADVGRVSRWVFHPSSTLLKMEHFPRLWWMSARVGEKRRKCSYILKNKITHPLYHGNSGERRSSQ